ncbi:MAG: ribonuclease P protein component [Clostridiales bacterium]|nr:ribonuclease P protein component [Clostridiales bacterium]
MKERRAFRWVYQRGKSRAYPCFVLYQRPSGLPLHRVGFSVSKKQGNAVERNRLKRRFREACRLMPEAFSRGTDYVFIIRSAAKTADFGQLQRQLRLALAQNAPVKRQK